MCYRICIILNLSFFQWCRIHSFALTREKRPFFDEVNILQTYQPRARTHGHLFVPEPDTPGPAGPNPHSASDKSSFNASRDAVSPIFMLLHH